MNTEPVLPSPHPLEAEIRRLRVLQKEGRHEEVARDAAPLAEALPENRDLSLILAVSLRHLSRIADALTVLERLEPAHPGLSLLHQERGLCYVALKDAPRAIDFLLRAVNINPALPMSWRMLEGVYRLIGDTQNAELAAAHVETLKNLPKEVVTATSLFSDGDLTPAEMVIRPFLLRHPSHPDAMRLLARIAEARGVLDDAETLLEALIEIAPDSKPARFDYARILSLRQRYVEARAELSKLLENDPENFDYRSLAASIAIGFGEHETAIQLCEELSDKVPDAATIILWKGHALKTMGRLPEAVEAYRSAAASKPDFGEAWWSLANLKTYRFDDDEIDRMREEEGRRLTPKADKIHLCFALGKALEDRAQYEDSWTYYTHGNAMKRAESQYRPEIFEGNTRRQTEVCTREFFEARRGWGVAAKDPIFILGLPRAGSTLIEQILASHSGVEGTHELPDLQRYVHELRGRDSSNDNPRYPGILTTMDPEAFVRFGERFLSDTRIFRSGKPHFIDKMPNNFRHIGLIHLMLPNAKIIDARREPVACCFSNLKQFYAQGQEFSYSIEDIARYYRTYLELMRHWDEALPGRVLRVQHEEVVEDLEGSVRRMLDYCGLDFEPGCVAFHKTARNVRTPSSEQVRQPIFRDGLDQWKNFEPWLEPLKTALGDAVTRYRAEPR